MFYKAIGRSPVDQNNGILPSKHENYKQNKKVNENERNTINQGQY